MKRIILPWVLPWALMAQEPPLSFQSIQERARTSVEQFRTEAWLAERRRALVGALGFLREGPSFGMGAGPRSNPDRPRSTDLSVDLDLPLFLESVTRRGMETALERADPASRQGAALEADFRLRQAYLDAWLAERMLALRQADLATVQSWMKAAVARREAGADPAVQASLVEGAVLKAQLDLDETRRLRSETWVGLLVLADLPSQPVPLEAPGEPVPPTITGLQARFEQGILRQVLQTRLELDRQALRLRESLATSRWSLRGSHSREGQERVTKFGLAYRLPRPGEGQAIRRETEANLQVVRRETENALLDLDARFQSSIQRLQSLAEPASAPAFEASLRAVGLRLAEGKERPSEALPIRRQLLEAQLAQLRRLHAAHLLCAELQALTEASR